MGAKGQEYKRQIKHELVMRLKQECAFWSYDSKSISEESINDKMLIALTMRHLDLDEIKMLYKIFSPDKIKQAWRDILVPEGDYLYTLNRFFAWYYFKAKNPDAYLKSLQTRHANQLLS